MVTTPISTTKLYQLLVDKLGQEQAEGITTYIETKVNDEFQTKQGIFSTKEDTNRIELALSQLETKIERGFNKQLWALIALILPLIIGLIWGLLSMHK